MISSILKPKLPGIDNFVTKLLKGEADEIVKLFYLSLIGHSTYEICLLNGNFPDKHESK